MEQIWDPLRKKRVTATPEERVRQWFIVQLRDAFGVPIPESELYRPHFSERCKTCAMMTSCNGCSDCGGCKNGKPRRDYE